MNKKILVHCCCGPCSTSSIKRLLNEGWQVVLHFENSNIWPETENEKRYGELLKVAKIYNVPVIRTPYQHDAWLDFVRGLENEPEHGKRCRKCFEFNLACAKKKAQELGIDFFTTTLTVSRFKSSRDIFEVGKKFEGFTEIDFKKKDGFSESVKLSKEWNLYRQQYCGCEFSFTKADNTNIEVKNG